MKQHTNISIYDTYSTELSAALRAVGCDLIDTDPLRRIFSEDSPANPSVSHGLRRGGKVQYRHKPESDEFNASTAELAQVFAAPDREYNKLTGAWDKVSEDRFDSMLAHLRGKLRSSAAGAAVDLDAIIEELPREIIRYIKAAFAARTENIKTIAERPDLVELVLVKKDDGHAVLHHIAMDPAKVQELLEA